MLVGGLDVDDVGGSVVVVSGAAVVCGVEVVWGGGVVFPELGEVVFTGGRVVAVVPAGPSVTTVDAGATVEEVDEVGAPFDVVVVAPVVEVVVARAVVEGDWVATCCLGDVSAPVAISRSRAASATVASA